MTERRGQQSTRGLSPIKEDLTIRGLQLIWRSSGLQLPGTPQTNDAEVELSGIAFSEPAGKAISRQSLSE